MEELNTADRDGQGLTRKYHLKLFVCAEKSDFAPHPTHTHTHMDGQDGKDQTPHPKGRKSSLHTHLAPCLLPAHTCPAPHTSPAHLCPNYPPPPLPPPQDGTGQMVGRAGQGLEKRLEQAHALCLPMPVHMWRRDWRRRGLCLSLSVAQTYAHTPFTRLLCLSSSALGGMPGGDGRILPLSQALRERLWSHTCLGREGK